MRQILLTTFFIGQLFCFGQPISQKTSQTLKLLQGTWVHDIDTLAIVTINNTTWSFHYIGDTATRSIDRYKIFLKDTSFRYDHQKSELLILENKTDTIKYEILGLTDSTLSLMTLHRGHINLYNKLKCKKCDTQQLYVINQNLENLTLEMVGNFLCSFHHACNTNAEFSEWSNQTLFSVIYKAPKIFLTAISQYHIDNKLLIKEIENPIHDPDLQKLYDKLKSVTGQESLKAIYLNAIITTCNKMGQTIKR